MRVEHSYIFIKEARFYAYHGVMPQEQTVGQEFLVSVRAGVDINMAMEHDMVEVTLDYGKVYQVIKREMDIPSQLVEHVAGRIARTLFGEFPQILSLDVSITKVNPPIGGDCGSAGVEIHLINDKTMA